MAYMPVEFDLHEFALRLGPKASSAFHARMKELGFTASESKGMMIYTRHDSRICAMIGQDMSLNFLQDFYDHTPGGTIYAILERLVVAFEGTMVGNYLIPSAGKKWGIRVVEGLNLSGRDEVGQRDMVQEEEVQAPTGGATPSNSAAAVGGNSYAQAAQATAQTGAFQGAGTTAHGSGQIPAQPGGAVQAPSKPKTKRQLQREKLYDFMVEQQYAQFVAANGGVDDANKKLELVQNFETQFPEEKEIPLSQKQIDLVIPSANYIGRNYSESEQCIVAEDGSGDTYTMTFEDGTYHTDFDDLMELVQTEIGDNDEAVNASQEDWNDAFVNLIRASVHQNPPTTDSQGVYLYLLRNIEHLDDFELVIRSQQKLHKDEDLLAPPSVKSSGQVTQQPSFSPPAQVDTSTRTFIMPIGWNFDIDLANEILFWMDELGEYYLHQNKLDFARKFMEGQVQLIDTIQMASLGADLNSIHQQYLNHFPNTPDLDSLFLNLQSHAKNLGLSPATSSIQRAEV